MMIKYKIKILNASCNPLKASYLHKLFTGRYMKENQSKIYNAQMRSIHSEYWGKEKTHICIKKMRLLIKLENI